MWPRFRADPLEAWALGGQVRRGPGCVAGRSRDWGGAGLRRRRGKGKGHQVLLPGPWALSEPGFNSPRN